MARKNIDFDWEQLKAFIKTRNLPEEECKFAYVCGNCGNFIEDQYVICAIHEDTRIGRVCAMCYRGINYQHVLLKSMFGEAKKSSQTGFTSEASDSMIEPSG